MNIYTVIIIRIFCFQYFIKTPCEKYVIYMKGEGVGFGKAILFNEHFVVYGIPAIVTAIGNYTTAKVTPFEIPDVKLTDNRASTPKYKEDK